MNDIHILVTMPQHAVFRTFFDADAMAALEHIGTVHWNTLGRPVHPGRAGRGRTRHGYLRHRLGNPGL